MESEHGYSSLLQAIQQLYSKIATNALHMRMHLYHNDPRQDQDNKVDISPPVIDRLLEIAEYEKNLPESLRGKGIAEHKSSTNPQWHEYESNEQAYESIDPEGMSELSRYLSEEHNHDLLHPELVYTLKNRIWQHTHDAIRCAHYGDYPNARLHTTIICNACRELSHYIDADMHKALVKTIENHMHNAGSVQPEYLA